MKNIILFIVVSLLACNNNKNNKPQSFFAAAGNIYFVSPSGSDNNSGTEASPFATLNKAWTVIKGGDEVYLRGGTYAFKTQQYLKGKSGSAGAVIKIWAYPNEKPILTKGVGYTNPNTYRGGCYFEGNYFHFKGIEIKGFTQPAGDPALWNGLLIMNSSNNTFEQINHHDNGSALYQEGNCTGNLFLNCDSWNNYDDYESGGNADGFSFAYNSNTSSVTTVIGCRSWNNSDDGYDTWDNQGMVIFQDCWSWKNGWKKGTTTVAGNGMGFKLAGGFSSSATKRKLTNCLSFSNLNHGFSQENEGIKCEFTNCTGYKNNSAWWFSVGAGSVFNQCVAYNNNNNQATLGNVSGSNNSASGSGDKHNWTNNVNDADYVSVSSVGVDGPRQADGGLPSLNFLRVVSGADIAGRGYTYGGTVVTPPGNLPPTANAGKDTTVYVGNTITLMGSGSDPDGTVASYGWVKLSGPSATIVSPATAWSNVTGMGVGTYVFELSVTDNKGAATKDQVTITIINTAPPSGKIYCSIILHGVDLKRRATTFFEKKSDGFYYDDRGIKRDVFLYQATDGRWYYKSGVNWVILF